MGLCGQKGGGGGGSARVLVGWDLMAHGQLLQKGHNCLVQKRKLALSLVVCYAPVMHGTS